MPRPQDLVDLLQRAAEAINNIRHSRLKEQLLQGANPEINTDREVLVRSMEQLHFRPDIGEALQEVERKVAGAATGFDFRGCMDLSRAAFEKIVEEAARKAASIRSKPLLPIGAGPFNPWKQLLQSCSVVDDKEAELLQKFYNYVSSVGTHALGNDSEEARLTKNIAIELGLLLVRRVEGLKP